MQRLTTISANGMLKGIRKDVRKIRLKQDDLKLKWKVKKCKKEVREDITVYDVVFVMNYFRYDSLFFYLTRIEWK